jgi:hypothetical protein
VTTHRAGHVPRGDDRNRRDGQGRSSARRRRRDRTVRNSRSDQVDELQSDRASLVNPDLRTPTPAAGQATPDPGQTPDVPADQSPGQPTLRHDTAPVDQRDFDDRHDTRATSDDQTLKRYIKLERHRTKCEWQRTLQRLLTVSVGTILYVAAVVALLRLIPHVTIDQAMLLAGAALASASGGYGLVVARQALRRYRRQRGLRDDPPS